ncbi:hypothetical protein E1A91_D04G130800v1 [Gossypium mustelinum]|uniref:non-specific serine/threonine protein kinase n=1 Tax=Gossypium mustelinum TaxID=34275 RepID=A0A5D2VDE2_GOSMU|nr:hypothetical protein E1A91_D04G130800v1 [Gossypium mustelinum]
MPNKKTEVTSISFWHLDLHCGICCVFSSSRAMKCFIFLSWRRKDEPKTPTPISTRSKNSTFTDREIGRSGSELNSQNVSATSSESIRRSSFPSMSQRPSNLKVFTVSELKSATKNFSRSAMLGEGGFGCVYKGVIKSPDDSSQKIEVAVKQLGKRGLQGHKEWVTEVNLLGVVEHPNLVKLVGYCAEDDERGIQRLLIYEYMPNSSVEYLLSERSETTLSWAMRLKIAQDAARGLAYLHEGMDFQIIFRDFKSSNILLDDQWRAKLSDFGLARLGPSEGLTHVSTAVVGTMGYAAPEYIQTGRLTSKIDVWSYGVFLYELITGRLPLDKNRPKSEQKLLEWVKPYLSKAKKFELIVDPRLKRQYQLKSAQKLAAVANRCVVRNPKSRPKMSEVLEMVNQIVEASTGAGNPEPPLKTKPFVDTSRGTERKHNRRIIDSRSGDKFVHHVNSR